MPATIQPSGLFKDNLAQLPPFAGIARIDLLDAAGTVAASIENQPGKQGSLAVYAYLGQAFGKLDEGGGQLTQLCWRKTEDGRFLGFVLGLALNRKDRQAQQANVVLGGNAGTPADDG